MSPPILTWQKFLNLAKISRMAGHWEYENHPASFDVVKKTGDLINELALDAVRLEGTFKDTRPHHRFIFLTVATGEHQWCAGNYRGARLPYLALCEAGLYSQGKLVQACVHPSAVARRMSNFHEKLVSELDRLKKVAKAQQLAPAKMLVAVANLVGTFFANFLEIHPYANGNGHISRILVWCLFRVFGINSKFWNVVHRNARPEDELILQYRNNNKKPLLDCFKTLIESENTRIQLAA